MSNDKRFYIRPDDPHDPQVLRDLTDAITAWVLKCRDDFQKRQIINEEEADE